MNSVSIFASGLVGLCGITSYIWPAFFSFALLLTAIALVIVLGILSAIWINLMLSSPHKTIVGAEHVLKQSEDFRNKLMRDHESQQLLKNSETALPSVFGRTVDSLLHQLLDFVIRDYITAYLKEYCYDLNYLSINIKDDLWGAVKNLHDKLLRVDQAKLIACDIVNAITNHFEKIREAKQSNIDQHMPPEFHLSMCIMSSEKELEYLRTLSEVLIMFLLPRAYSLSPTKYFLREVICCKIFKPFVDLVTDPDFFNQNLINYIEKANQQQINLPKKALEHVELFIEKEDDIQVLKQIRYNIVTKLMQATTLQNLNRAKGVDLDNDKSNMQSSGIQKSEISAAKKLKKTINHLTMTKNLCEKKLTSLGCDLGYHGDDFTKVLSLPTILDHITGRKYLSQFLQTLASHDLIRFWIAVEELRNAQRNQWHQLGAEIFYTFIRNPVSEIKVDKTIRKRMEAFLLGDKGPEVFYEVQLQVVQTIEDKYYQPFLISDYYKEMIIAIEAENEMIENDTSGSIDEKTTAIDSFGSTIENGLNVEDHSNYARRKLDQLEERLSNKVQALTALKSSMRPESKVLSKLAAEVEWLQGEKRQLEAHLTRTEMWAENLGRWTAIVQCAEASEDKEMPQFVLVVQMSETDTDTDGDGNICSGWVVCRNLTQFQELHKKLRPLCSDVRNLDLPSNTFKFLFGKSDRSSLDKAKAQIQKYLDFVLKNEFLNQSEAIYSFLSPSSEHLKHSSPSPKKSRFSFSTIFKSGSEQGASFSILKDNSEEDISCLDGAAVDAMDFIKSNGQPIKFSEDGKDSIAEPLYALLSELFDMRGVFKYVRKTLIGFVQVTYGRNINRQIYETISWWFSEEMLHYYMAQILKNFWPGGTLAPAGPFRTEVQRFETAQKAQQMVINNVPEILTTLVGSTAAKNGAKKMFDALQEKNMNKQLFYEILDVTLDAVFPELQ